MTAAWAPLCHWPSLSPPAPPPPPHQTVGRRRPSLAPVCGTMVRWCRCGAGAPWAAAERREAGQQRRCARRQAWPRPPKGGQHGARSGRNRDFGNHHHSQTLHFAACSNRLGSADDWASFRTGHRASPAVYWARPCCASSFGPRAAPILPPRKVCYGAGAWARQCPPGAEVVPGR